MRGVRPRRVVHTHLRRWRSRTLGRRQLCRCSALANPRCARRHAGPARGTGGPRDPGSAVSRAPQGAAERLKPAAAPASPPWPRLVDGVTPTGVRTCVLVDPYRPASHVRVGDRDRDRGADPFAVAARGGISRSPRARSHRVGRRAGPLLVAGRRRLPACGGFELSASESSAAGGAGDRHVGRGPRQSRRAHRGKDEAGPVSRARRAAGICTRRPNRSFFSLRARSCVASTSRAFSRRGG